MKKKTLPQILNDLGEFLQEIKDDIEKHGEDYYKYDRMDFLKRFFVQRGNERVQDIYDTDLQTISTLLIQMSLFNQQIFIDDNDKIIDRYEGRNKMKLTEMNYRKFLNENKLIESFVWYCFSKIDEEQKEGFMNSYRHEFGEFFKDKMNDKLNTNSEDEDMNKHNETIIQRETEDQLKKVNSSLKQYTDQLGFSKNDWKKILNI